MTASIYTVAMLRAYLQGKVAVLDKPVPTDQIAPNALPAIQATIAAHQEVIALCEGIEAHDKAMTKGTEVHVGIYGAHGNTAELKDSDQ